MSARKHGTARSALAQDRTNVETVLHYKLPKQQPRRLPLALTSTIRAAKEFIQRENEITATFKLRVYVAGKARYLHPDQTLSDASQLGGTLNVFYADAAQKQRERRLQASATAKLVKEDVEEEGRKGRKHVTEETNRLSALLVPHFGPDVENATVDQLRKRKAASAEEYDKKIAEAKEREAALRQMKPAELRAKLQEKGVDVSGPKKALVRRLCNSGQEVGGSSGPSEPQGTTPARGAAKRPRSTAAAASGDTWPLATPPSLQAPPVRTLLQAAEGCVRERQPKKKVSPGPPPQDLARQIFHKGFFFGALLEEVWKWLQTRRPYVVRYGRFRKEVITRPKENFALQRADGAFPSYQWGQVKADYTLIEVTPEPVLKCARMLETHFGHPEGYLNSQLATYYVHGEDQYLVIHQDKAVDHRSTGDVEDSTPIYNASFGAMRHFVLTDLASLGEHERGKMLIYEDFAMHSGDLVVIPPKTNRDYGHGVYKDPSADRLRVSIVFRHVDKHWVRKLEDGTWEHCSRDSHGDDGPWAPLPLGDEPANPAGRLDARRELCEEKLREKQERREQRGGKRARKQQPGAPGDLEPLSAHLGAGDTAV